MVDGCDDDEDVDDVAGGGLSLSSNARQLYIVRTHTCMPCFERLLHGIAISLPVGRR